MINLDNFNKVLSACTETGIVVMQSGIRLHTLSEKLHEHGLAMPNLGSINEQSIAGAISTGTHGSSAQYGLLSESVIALKVTLSSGKTEFCSADDKPELFRAALLSLGALGIITEVVLKAVPVFKLKWHRTINKDQIIFASWMSGLWTQEKFVRVWWYPYTGRAVLWSATESIESESEPAVGFCSSLLGYHTYQGLLYFSLFAPMILPWVEWFISGMEYGFVNGTTATGVEASHKALLMNCLYPQFVNEWALPLERGLEALRRLNSWLNHLTSTDPGYEPHHIPFCADGLYIHSPLELRVCNTTVGNGIRPYLDPSSKSGPTVYINATLYRPYYHDPPMRLKFYRAFEWLMRDMGGKPHWAKNFTSDYLTLAGMYGEDLIAFNRVRDEADPTGMFIGPWHRQKLMSAERSKFELEETENSPTDGVM